MSCEVEVAQGTIRGKITHAFDNTKYYSFEGIPYAKPPVAELRFRDPQPILRWSGIKDCTKPGNKCAQLNPFSKKGFEGSEDCLYLNIYTPHLPPVEVKKLPVLFFIHGGRLTIGYGDYYRPDYFMRHGVVLVTINYRLNILGFLCLDIPEVPGNAGMKDCAMALRWVRSNISKFHGDVNNITVFGESAGAAISASFLMSELTIGLYDKVIAQSGNSVADVFFHKQDNIGVASHIASLLGKESKDPKTLYDFYMCVPIEELVQAFTMADVSKPSYIISPILLPVIEKKFDGTQQFLCEAPKDSLRMGRFAEVPIIAGSNLFEGAAFVRKDGNGIIFEKDFTHFIPPCLYIEKTDPKAARIAKRIKEFYFNDTQLEDAKTQYIRFLSEFYFQRDITLFAETIARKSNKFFAYNFQYEGSLNINTMKELGLKGTSHGDSVQYQFYSKNKANRVTERDKRVIDFFSEAWCNFAKYGKPSWGNQNVECLPYRPGEKLTLIIDDRNRMVRNEDYTNYTFWQELCSEKAKL